MGSGKGSYELWLRIVLMLLGAVLLLASLNLATLLLSRSEAPPARDRDATRAGSRSRPDRAAIADGIDGARGPGGVSGVRPFLVGEPGASPHRSSHRRATAS